MKQYDAIVVGGGPGGTSAGSYLARAGHNVCILEKEIFPRFHIGESLLPYNRAIFEELGLIPELERLGFPKKYGAQFHLGNGSKSTCFVFKEGKFTRHHEAFQVERSRFDHLLLKHAAKLGAEVREGCTVKSVKVEGNIAEVRIESPAGEELLKSKFLVDASGRSNLTGNQEQVREIHPRMKKIALFGHFEGVRLDPGEKGGDTVIIRLHEKWFWIIPISKEKTSVGCVMDKDEFQAANAKPETIFNSIVQSHAVTRERMEEARLAGAIQTTSDFSYHNKKLVSPRVIRVGDAAGFMDPIFSAGVYLAMFSGREAAMVISKALKEGSDGTKDFARYEKRINKALHTYWEMVEHYYTTPFMELFLEPRHGLALPAAVNAALAGELEGGWQIRWRMRVFFWLVKVQKIFPLVPRISFS